MCKVLALLTPAFFYAALFKLSPLRAGVKMIEKELQFCQQLLPNHVWPELNVYLTM